MSANSLDILCKNFERVLDALSDGVFITNPAGVTLKINRMYEQLTGLRQEQVQGKNVRTLVQEGVFDHILNPEIVKTGKPASHVQQLRDGKRLILSGVPVFDEQGTLCLVVTFARDVTLLTQLHEQLAEQRQRINHFHEQLAYMANEQVRDSAPVYASAVMRETVALMGQLAATDATILLLGETGVGKDVFARHIHDVSERHSKLMLKVDCGGIAETLTESEMFGYAPGAFTGASSKGKAGYFEIADGSTIFLDEVGELSLGMQTRLLRVLQDGEIMRVGSTTPKKVNVRVIAATNRDLTESVAAGTFRRDLYYRLNVAAVQIPPLRERKDDVRPLAELFLRQFCTKYRKGMAFMDITIDMLARYAWPGNVRELQNLVHSLVITRNTALIAPRDLPSHISDIAPDDSSHTSELLSATRPLRDIVADMERNFLLRAVELHGSAQKVAEMFGISRSTVFRKIRR